jgi:hypothetical protein
MKYSINDKISFENLLTAILYFLYRKEKGDNVYAYYEEYANSLFRCDMDLVKSQPLHADLLSAIALLDHIVFKDSVQYFEALRNFPDPIFENLSLSDFLSQKQHFYENKGKKKSSASSPASELYFHSRVVDYLYQTDSKSIINHHIAKSTLAKQLETIGKQIEKENYKITTVKKLANDILRKLYPHMTEHEQNFAWRFFKDDHFADAANIKEKNNL